MIKIIESPQRADMKITYVVDGDILNVTVDDVTEEFDFTGLPEGRMTEIEPEELPINPILGAEKIGDEIIITLSRFYGKDEKEVYEFGENQMGI
jgi:hypothetical protein